MGKSNTNSILAAHVTMYGRLKLFDVMHNLGQRVLYCDTGYINISLKQNKLQTQSLPSPKRLLIKMLPQPSNHLGEWSDELNGGFINKVIFLGAKNYAYRYLLQQFMFHIDHRVGDKWTVKARGFTLGEDTLHVLNGTAMERQLRAFVFENKEDVIYVHQKGFKRSRMMEITTVDVSKKHKVVMDKRAIMFADDQQVITKPFGFVYFPGCFIL